MIITRMLGLQAAAAWAIGTRAFAMITQMVCRLADVSGPAISEMVVRAENTLLRERYQALLSLTGSLSGFAAVGYALCNTSFVAVWTHGEFAWMPLNDLLLGLWLIILAILHCHNGLILLTKKIGFMRYAYFVEGLVFVTAAFLVARRGGLPAVIACSVICSTLFSGAYGVWRVSRYFNLSIYEVGLAWLAPMGRVLVLFVPAALLGWWASGPVAEAIARLALETGLAPRFMAHHPEILASLSRLVLNCLLAGSVGFYLFLHYGLSLGVQRELLQRAPKLLNPLLRRVFVSLPDQGL